LLQLRDCSTQTNLLVPDIEKPHTAGHDAERLEEHLIDHVLDLVL
jgi:hypothetical protein